MKIEIFFLLEILKIKFCLKFKINFKKLKIEHFFAWNFENKILLEI